MYIYIYKYIYIYTYIHIYIAMDTLPLGSSHAESWQPSRQGLVAHQSASLTPFLAESERLCQGHPAPQVYNLYMLLRHYISSRVEANPDVIWTSIRLPNSFRIGFFFLKLSGLL